MQRVYVCILTVTGLIVQFRGRPVFSIVLNRLLRVVVLPHKLKIF